MRYSLLVPLTVTSPLGASGSSRVLLRGTTERASSRESPVDGNAEKVKTMTPRTGVIERTGALGVRLTEDINTAKSLGSLSIGLTKYESKGIENGLR
jgi:hypothetical protein